MNYITTTELRTKTSELIRTLKSGRSVDLIHRSKVVGELRPKKTEQKRPFDPVSFEKFRKTLGPLPYIPRKEREKIYRRRLEEKYGKGLSRR